MRVMPSVTETIVPMLRASVTPLKLSIRCLIRSLISVALIAIWMSCSIFLSCQLVRNAVQPRAHGAIDNQIACLQNGPADQSGIRVAMKAYLALEPALQSGGQRFALTVLQRRCGSDSDVDYPFGFVLQLVKESRNLGEVAETPVLRERLDEITAVLVEGGARQIHHHPGQVRVGYRRIPEQVVNPWVFDHRSGRGESGGPRTEPLILLCLLESRFRIRPGDGCLVCHGVGSA